MVKKMMMNCHMWWWKWRRLYLTIVQPYTWHPRIVLICSTLLWNRSSSKLHLHAVLWVISCCVLFKCQLLCAMHILQHCNVKSSMLMFVAFLSCVPVDFNKAGDICSNWLAAEDVSYWCEVVNTVRVVGEKWRTARACEWSWCEWYARRWWHSKLEMFHNDAWCAAEAGKLYFTYAHL